MQIIGNQLILQVLTTGAVWNSASATIQPGVWYDAVGTWDGSNLDLYLNGALAASTPATGAPYRPQDNFSLAAYPAGGGAMGYFSPISVAQAAVWSQVLTAGQIKEAAAPAHSITVTTSGQGTASASAQGGAASAWPGEQVSLTEQAAADYHFTGWQVTSPSDGSVTIGADGTFTMPGEDVAVTAGFAPNTYTVHFDGNGADGGATADQAFTYGTAAALTANGYTDTGHYFAGWATTPGGVPVYTDGESVQNLTATNGATVTLYAAWIPDGSYEVTVTSGAHGTASADSFAHEPGDKVTLTATPDTGYHLAAWKVTSPSDGSVTVASDGTFTMPGENVAVTAEFAPDTYKVDFKGNGAAAGSMADVTLTYDQPQALPALAFASQDQEFAGWATSASGPAAYAGGATVENLTATDNGTVTLYAQWAAPQVSAGSWPTLPAGFVTATLRLPGTPASGSVSQPLPGLWNGTKAVSFSKASGDSWLSVSPAGVVTGTAPGTVPQNEGTITVSATDGTTTSQILVEVPVLSARQAPQVKTASWDAWQDGANVSDAVGKNLAVIASQGIGVIGFSDGGGAMAEQVASALGWHFESDGDLGIVSAYPLAPSAGVTAATAAAPATAVTVEVGGQAIRVWDTALDSAGYGPYNACFNGVTSPSKLISDEESTTRYAEAQAVAREMAGDVHGRTPVVLLGDLQSPSASDWTKATASSHCGVGAVDWPVPDVFAKAGLTDSFRVANPSPVTDPGDTWSPLASTAPGSFALPGLPASAAGKAIPQDRIDYVDYAGQALHVVESHALTVGWPSAADVAGNSWASDHAAAVTTFTVGNGASALPSAAPAVSVHHDTVTYQVGHGPANAAAFLAQAAPAATPGSKVAVDLSQVDFAAEGWYTAQVTATSPQGLVSNPADVVVRVAPVTSLTLPTTTATFNVGDVISQAAVIAQLTPQLDENGRVNVDLASVNADVPGSYPVTVTATDQWGFTVTQPATVVVQPSAPATSGTSPG